MARLYLVRHGRAAGSYGEDADPGLDELGRTEAEAVAQKLSTLKPLRLLTSPMKRTRETALPLERLWRRDAIVEDAVGEIPSPQGLSLPERVHWLRGFMGTSWRDAEMALAQWRENLIATLAAQTEDSVIVTHYIAINAAAGAALGDDRVVVFSPDNCSVTVIEAVKRKLALIERGHEAPLTKVN